MVESVWTAFACGMATTVVAFASWRASSTRRQPVTRAHLRGRALTPPQSITRSAESPPAQPGTSLQWGRVCLPTRAACGHFAFIGTTGSGKTILQRLLLQSVLPVIGTGQGCRALVYDAKQDSLPLIGGMSPGSPVRILHPSDRRASAWDMAVDITGPNAALQVATMLIPRSKNDTNPFFANAARHLLFGVLLGLIRFAPGRWTFRQLLLIARDPARLESALRLDESTRHLLLYFNHEGTFQNIVSTILTCTAPYETVAAAWDRASHRLSLRGWLEEESVLVLGNDEANRAAVDTLNRMVFQRLAELILAGPETQPEKGSRTWLFLDEVREMGRLEGLSRLLTKGRSKGAAVVLGLQDVAGLRDVYGREVAEEILGQCNAKVILRLNSPDTADWASRLFGHCEILESATTESRSRSFRFPGWDTGGNHGRSVSSSIARREAVLDSEFLDLPETTRANGLTGLFLSPSTGGFRDTIPGDWIARRLQSPDRAIPESIPRPESDQYLRPWSGADALDEPREASPGLGRVQDTRGTS